MLTDGELCDLLNLFGAESQQDYIEDVLIARGWGKLPSMRT